MIYDRADSAIAKAQAEDFDWDAIFEGASWFHFTGITPALNDNVAAICLEACKAAKEAGVKISCDLNYRNKVVLHVENNRLIQAGLSTRQAVFVLYGVCALLGMLAMVLVDSSLWKVIILVIAILLFMYTGIRYMGDEDMKQIPNETKDENTTKDKNIRRKK